MTTTTVAVIGATGFVGRPLATRLALERDVHVRCLAREIRAIPVDASIDAMKFDLDNPEASPDALEHVDTAYYLVHSMGAGADFAERDRAYAAAFARAAELAGVRRVVYLGGLFPRHVALSEHLASRREVGDILRTRADALVVRAGIIVGAGGASFEIMRDLVMRLPVMVTPRWVTNRCQPIGLDDVVEVLARARTLKGGREVDLVGPDVLTYREMLLRLGRRMHRRPVIVGVPVLSPGLSSHWLRFITAVPLPVARALVESLRHDAVSDGADLCAETGVSAAGFDQAIRRALAAA